MDLLTPIGLIIGISAVLYVMVQGNIASLLLNTTALIFVFGGTLGSTLITYPWKLIKKIPGAVLMIFFPKKHKKPMETIDKLTRMAELARSKGVDMLLDELNDEDDRLLKSGVRMLIEGVDESYLQESMRLDIDFTRQRHQQVQKVFVSMGGYSPIFGLLGTLIGVIQVLRHIGDPTVMGGAMAIAITTTFYGIFGCNFIFVPIAGKLETYSDEEILLKEIDLLGILSIKQQMLPSLMKKKLEKIVANVKSSK